MQQLGAVWALVEPDNKAFVVRFWGVRGSIPTPGPETVRYGGNTTCIEVRCDDEVLVIDTGTGARRLGRSLMQASAGAPLRVSVIYSHLHLDHIQGFPFFEPIYAPTTTLDIYSAKPDEMTTRSVLQSQMTYPSFPVGLANLPSTLNFHTVDRGDSVEIAGVKVSTCPINHPGGAMAIRVDHRGKSFVQCSDIEHTSDAPEPELVALAQGADFLSFDSTYIGGEESEHPKGWGHSTWQHGVAVADAAGVDRFIAFHHDPSHHDDLMDAVGLELEARRPGSLVAREGMELDLLTGEIRT